MVRHRAGWDEQLGRGADFWVSHLAAALENEVQM